MEEFTPDRLMMINITNKDKTDKIKYALVALLLTAFVLFIANILPIRCTPPTINTDNIGGDVIIPFASQTCYSIYHKKFWTEERRQPIQLVWGGLVGRVWVTNHELRNKSATDSTRQLIIHHQ